MKVFLFRGGFFIIQVSRDELLIIFNRAANRVRQKAVKAETSIYYVQDDHLIEEEWGSSKQYLENNLNLPYEHHFYPFNPKNEPTMTVFAGCNGAGKSTLIESMFEDMGSVINPDLFAAQLNPSDPRSVDYQAGKCAVENLKRNIKNKTSFQVETTLAGNYMLNQMRIAREAGYSVHLYYIGLHSVSLHKARVKTRVAEGGHWISEADIERRYFASLLNLPAAIDLSHNVVIIDNSGPIYETIVEVYCGNVSYISNHLPNWLHAPFHQWQSSRKN